MATGIVSILPHGIGVEARFSLGLALIGWRDSKTTGETLPEKVVIWQFAQAFNGSLAGDGAALDTADTINDLELKTSAEDRRLHRMPKIHDFLVMGLGSQNLCDTQMESPPPNKQMTVVIYISDTRQMVRASWSNFQPDGAAASKYVETSPLPPVLSAKNLPSGRTQALDVRRIRRIDHHPAQSHEAGPPESISETEYWNIR